jgi:hypothetical protein
MNTTAVLVGAPPPETLAALERHLADWGWTLYRAALDALPGLVRRVSPAVVLVDLSGGLRSDDVCHALHAGLLPVIALNPSGLPGRTEAVASGCSLVLDYPLDWPQLKACLHSPHTASGGLLTVGPLFGRTAAEAQGTAGLLAHDLKSPISLIISSLEVLTAVYDGTISDDVARLLHGSLHAAYRQMYMVSDLIDLTRLELDSYPLELETFEAAALLAECLETERATLEAKGLEFTVELPGAPLPVCADRHLIRRAVYAILDNAVRFTVRGDRLTVAALPGADSVTLRFADSGRPIQRGFEHEIVRRAPQWDGRQGGTRTSIAMGLPFTYAVAAAHGGSFAAATDSASGLTTFDFTLPLSQPSETP